MSHSEFELASQQTLPKASELAKRFSLVPNPHPASEEAYRQVMNNLKFGVDFTDHMASARWNADQGWTQLQVEPYAPLNLEPGCAVLHYGQAVFEGIKVYRHADGSLWTFRPAFNAARINYSARRLALPELPAQDFVGSIAALIQQDARWVPGEPDTSLYLRPFMFAEESFLGVRPAKTVRYLVIASPSGPYFKGGFKPVSIWVSDRYHRAGPGGTGDAKTAGNYAASLLPQLLAAQQGFQQVCFLDSTYTYLEELGGMNVFVVKRDGSVATPQLTGTILEGGTRGAIIQLLRDEGRQVSEELIALDQLVDQIRNGEVTEMFACGTAAVVTAIGRLASSNFEVELEVGPTTKAIYQQLTQIQTGQAPDRHHWLYRLA